MPLLLKKNQTKINTSQVEIQRLERSTQRTGECCQVNTHKQNPIPEGQQTNWKIKINKPTDKQTKNKVNQNWKSNTHIQNDDFLHHDKRINTHLI